METTRPSHNTQQVASRRTFLRLGTTGFTVASAAGVLLLRASPARGLAAEPRMSTPMDRLLIVNADDFGLSAAVDEGILEAHERGIVTSTSLLVGAPHAAEAVRAAARYPKLGLGLHVNFVRGNGWAANIQNRGAVRHQLDQQLTAFIRLVGTAPDHLNSHHHAHRSFNVSRPFLEAGARYNIPVRGFSDVTYIGSFYGQWVYGKTEASHITVDYLVSLLRELPTGVTELSCHPGRPDNSLDEVYSAERAVELKTLTDPHVKAVINEEGIKLINYRDYQKLAPTTTVAGPCPPGTVTLDSGRQ